MRNTAAKAMAQIDSKLIDSVMLAPILCRPKIGQLSIVDAVFLDVLGVCNIIFFEFKVN